MLDGFRWHSDGMVGWETARFVNICRRLVLFILHVLKLYQAFYTWERGWTKGGCVCVRLRGKWLRSQWTCKCKHMKYQRGEYWLTLLCFGVGASLGCISLRAWNDWSVGMTTQPIDDTYMMLCVIICTKIPFEILRMSWLRIWCVCWGTSAAFHSGCLSKNCPCRGHRRLWMLLVSEIHLINESSSISWSMSVSHLIHLT